MIDFVALLIVNAFLILGFFEITKEEMILYFFKKYTFWLPKFIKKPLYDCPTCMSSIHSTYVFYYFNTFSFDILPLYCIYVVALAGMSFFINSLVPADE